jgi:hypothetical protein
MAVKLTHFLAKLATEPREYARFLKDPETYMRKAGLSKTNQKVLKSRNRKKIEAALRKEQKSPINDIVLFIIVLLPFPGGS